MKGRHPVELKRSPPYVIKAAALRLGFTPEGAEAVANTEQALADAWLDTALRYLAHARDAVIVAQAPLAIERVRLAIKTVEAHKRAMQRRVQP